MQFFTRLFILLLIYQPLALLGQEKAIKFRQLGTGVDGFLDERFTRILQDTHGLMWFATSRGLVRYDGSNHKRYRHDPDDPESLSSDEISTIFEDGEGNLWVGTINGLNLMDRKKGLFKRYGPRHQNGKDLQSGNIWSLEWDPTDGLLIGTDTRLFSMRDEKIKHVADFGSGVSVLCRDTNGMLWVGTETSGLYRFNGKSYEKATLEGNELVRTIAARSDGIYVGTATSGVAHFSHEGHLIRGFRKYQVKEKDRLEEITAMVVDHKDRIWVGSKSRLFIITLDGGIIDFPVKKDERGPREAGITSLFFSDDGLLWAATNGSGVDILNMKTEEVEYYRIPGLEVWSVLVDQQDRLWVGTGSGLALYDYETGNYTETLPLDRIRFIHQDQKGRFFCGTDSAFYAVNPQNLKRPKPIGKTQFRYFSIWEDEQSSFWLGTNRGLKYYDPDSDKILKTIGAQKGSDAHLPGPIVTCLASDSNGHLWVGTYTGGLSRFDRERGHFKHYLPEQSEAITNSDILDLLVDRTDTVWIATQSGGLTRFDPVTNKAIHFSNKNGFPDNTILNLEMDHEGFLWVITGSNTAVLDPSTNQWQTYSRYDGMIFGPATTGSTFFHKSGGYLYIGGGDGLVRFKPKQYVADAYDPSPLVMTSLRIGNKNVSDLMSFEEPLILNPERKSFSLEFACLDYRTKDPKHLAYLREEIDDDWQYAEGVAKVEYTNYLSLGGEGYLRIKAVNARGIWKEEVLTIQSPAPTWVRLLPIIIPVVLILIFWVTHAAFAFRERKRRQRLREQARLAEERATLAENLREIETQKRHLQEENSKVLQEHLEQVSTELANDLHDGPLSELTGLGFRLASLNDGLDEQGQANIEDLTTNLLPNVCAALRHVCGDLLAPDFEYGLENELDSYAEVVANRNPGLTIHRDLHLEAASLQPEQMASLFRIYRTLLKNVEKHAEASEVHIAAKAENDRFHLLVKDDGKGFNVPDDWDDFKRNKHYGMYMAGYFTTMLNGEIKVDSKPGLGTAITVDFPMAHKRTDP